MFFIISVFRIYLTTQAVSGALLDRSPSRDSALGEKLLSPEMKNHVYLHKSKRFNCGHRAINSRVFAFSNLTRNYLRYLIYLGALPNGLTARNSGFLLGQIVRMNKLKKCSTSFQLRHCERDKEKITFVRVLILLGVKLLHWEWHVLISSHWDMIFQDYVLLGENLLSAGRKNHVYLHGYLLNSSNGRTSI